MPRYCKSGGMSGFTYPAQHLRLNETVETGLIRLPLGAEIGKLEGVKKKSIFGHPKISTLAWRIGCWASKSDRIPVFQQTCKSSDRSYL